MPTEPKKKRALPDGSASPGKEAATASRPASRPRSARRKPEPLPPFHVVLLDDNDHTHEYVMEMLQTICGHPREMGYKLAKQVDEQGRAIVLTTHKEKAELKREQIHSFGADPRVATCQGSMSAIIQPAEG